MISFWSHRQFGVQCGVRALSFLGSRIVSGKKLHQNIGHIDVALYVGKTGAVVSSVLLDRLTSENLTLLLNLPRTFPGEQPRALMYLQV